MSGRGKEREAGGEGAAVSYLKEREVERTEREGEVSGTVEEIDSERELDKRETGTQREREYRSLREGEKRERGRERVREGKRDRDATRERVEVYGRERREREEANRNE